MTEEIQPQESAKPLVVRRNPFEPETLADAIQMASEMAKAGFFGLNTGPKMLTMMKIAADDNMTLAQVTRRFHAMSDGKVAQKASWTQAEFEKRNTIIWHIRSDEECAATFIRGKDIDEATRTRALARFKLQFELEYTADEDGQKRSKLKEQIAELQHEGEVTIVRTFDDAEQKGIATTLRKERGDDGKEHLYRDEAGNVEVIIKDNWRSSPRQMLTARCLTEGVNLIDSSVTAGGYTEDELDHAAAPPRVIQGHIIEQNDNIMSKAEEIELLKKRISEIQKEAPSLPPKKRKELFGKMADYKIRLDELQGDQLDLSPSKPALVVEAELIPPTGAKWEGYKIKVVKAAAYKGKLLSEIVKDGAAIEALYEKRSVPFLSDPDDAKRHEAEMIKLAYESTK